MRRVIGGLILIGLALRSFFGSGQYRSNETAWAAVLAVHPHHDVAWLNLGQAHAEAGFLPQARAEYERAIADSTNNTVKVIASLNLAVLDGTEGKWTEAQSRTTRTRDHFPGPWPPQVEAWARTLESWVARSVSRS